MIKKIAVLLLMVSVIGFADENTEYGNLPAVERPRVALVLGGGGAKGAAHIAVLELIEELKIPVDIIIGVSAGAIVGGLYSAGYSTEMIKEIVFDMDLDSFFQDPPISPFEKELRTENLFPLYTRTKENANSGLFRGSTTYTLFKALTVKIPSYIDFDTLPIPFRAGVVEIPEGRSVLIREGDIAEAMRASMSIPGVFDPFNIDGNLYIDGGTLNNLPIRQAKELGYDIVIAVDLQPRPQNIDPSVIEVPELLWELYVGTVSEDQYPLADVVFKFDLRNYSIADYHKSEEIYSLAMGVKESMRAELESVKALFSFPEPPARMSYNELPDFVPEDLVVTGALPRDQPYIEKCFARYIKWKLLKQENTDLFIQAIYKTGNYRFVEFRPHIQQGKTVLKLNLYPVSHNDIVFLMGGNYRGIKGISSDDLISNLNLQGSVQFHGLSGPGSVLSLEGSVFGIYSLGVQYLQPLSSFSFLSTRMELLSDSDFNLIVIDSNTIKLGLTEKAWEEKNLYTFSWELQGGIFLDRHLIKGGPLLFTILNNFINPVGKMDTALGLGLSYTYGSMDYSFMPSMGVSVMLENRLYFPLEFEQFFNMISLDMEAALPLGRGFSIAAGAFAGTNTGPGLPAEFSRLGFNSFDQHYFSNVSVTNNFFPRKAAASLALQYQLGRNLFIMGSRLIFSLSGSVGELFSEWDDFTTDKLIWNVSLNAGLRIRNNYGVHFRIGLGSTGSYPLKPFIAFDIGRQTHFRR